METMTFNRTTNIDSPFGKNSIFYTHYFDTNEIPEDLAENESRYKFQVFEFGSGTEVFEKYNDVIQGSVSENELHIYIEKENSNKSNLFGTACRVRMGQEVKDVISKLHTNDLKSKIVVENQAMIESVKQLAEGIARFSNGKITNSTPLYHALLIELMDQSQLDKMLKDALSVNNKLADFLSSGVELMDKWKFTEENYDYEKHFLNIRNSNPLNPNGYQPYTYKPIIPIPATMSYAESFRSADQNTFAAAGAKKLSEFTNYFEEISTGVIYNMAKATPTKFDDLLLAAAGFLKEIVDEALPEQVKTVLKKLKAVYAQVLQAISSMAQALKERAGIELARTNAFLCGLINGLISLGQTMLMLLAMVAGNIPLLEWEKLSPLEIAKHQETLEFVEDFVDLISENAVAILTGVTKLFSDGKVLKELTEFVQMLKRKFLSLNEFFWAYFVGGVLFEIILDAVVAYFTGGTSLVAQASAKISRLTAKTSQLGAKAANFGKNLGQKASSLGDLWKFVREKLDEFFEAIKNNNLVNWLKKKFFEFTDDTEGLRKLYLSKWLKKFDKSFFNHIEGEFNTGLLERVMPSGFKYVDEFLVSQGGHRGSAVIKGNIDVEYFIEPNGVYSMLHLADDVPFKAKISIRYRDGYLVKNAESSMFPKNWDVKRIQEEVAWVYENTVSKGVGVNPNSLNKKFKQYKFKDVSGSFDVLIEVDDSGVILNSYPLL